jgi:hypothetical protein
MPKKEFSCYTSNTSEEGNGRDLSSVHQRLYVLVMLEESQGNNRTNV